MEEFPKIEERDLQKLHVAKVANAIEKDAGRALPGLRTSLKQAKARRLFIAQQRALAQDSEQTPENTKQ